MAQLSPPFRIALVAVVAVCALWFTVLKPKDPAADAPAPTAPGATGLANDVNAAKGVAAASDAANAKVQQAAGGATGAGTKAGPTAAAGTSAATARATARAATPAKAPAPKAKAAPAADRTAPLLRALDAKRAVVMVFYDRKGIDDRAVRKAVAATDRHHGKVVVKAVPVSQVGRYDAITRGAQVLESPTVLVIAPDRKARAIVGFTTTAELDQAVGDALAPPAKK